MSLIHTMTCPDGTTLNDCLNSSLTPSTQNTTSVPADAANPIESVRRTSLRFASSPFRRLISPVFLLATLGLFALGCGDDGGGGSSEGNGSNDDTEENDNPRDDSNDDSDDSNDAGNSNDSDDSDDSNDSDTSDDSTNNESPDASGNSDESDDSDSQDTSAPQEPPPDDLPVDENAADSWTILVYLNGDNDLEHFGLVDIMEMAEVPSNEDVTVLVQIDRAEDGASPGYSSEDLAQLGNFTSTKRLRVTQNQVEELDDLGEVNMGDPETLSDFLTWGIRESKTGHYAFVFWDHGGGWDLFGPDDSHDHDGLDLPEIAAGLANGLAGAERETKLDVVGFDACLMATFETAETVRPYASLLLASQELEPGSGWDWTALSTLTEDPSRTGEDWGSQVIEQYGPHVGETRDATLSLVDLGKLGDLKAAVDDLASELAKAEPVVVGQVRARSPEFAAGHGKDLVDLGQLVSELGNTIDSVKASSDAVLELLDEVVVSKYHGPDAGYSHGLSLYFPLNPQTFNAEYAKLSGINAWQDYLKSYLDAGEEVATLGGFTNPEDIGSIYYNSGLWYLIGDLAPGTAEQIVSADLYFGMADSGIYVFLGQTDAQWDETQAFGGWDLTALVGYQGDVSAPFYYAQHYSSESETYSFTTPVLYNGEYLLFYEMVLDSNFELISESYYGEIEGAIGQVAVPDSGTIQPVLIALDGNGEVTQVPLDTMFDLSTGVSFSFEVLPSGYNVVMTLVITDLGGNTDSVYYETLL